MKIGNIEPESNIFLAPMAGITDSVFRRICKEYGAALTYSEMVSAKGLYYGDKKTAELMEASDKERPYAIQIFGSDPDIMAEVVPKVMEYSPDFIDINMGCPAPKIVKNGDGSAILKNPALAGKIMRAVSDASPVPVTVKIRSGWDCDNAVETAKILEANGAAAIAVHGRTRFEFYSGLADWNVIKRVKDSVSVPVIGSGDVFTPEDAKNMLDSTGCDAVMIARGAQGNPFIFRQVSELINHGNISFFPTPAEKISAALLHTEMLVKAKGSERGIKEARKHIAWYIKGIPSSAVLKREVFKISDIDAMRRILTGYINHLQ